MRNQIINTIISFLLILLWTYTALSKLLDFEQFKSAMSRQALPFWLQSLLIWSLPPIELAISALLVFSQTRLVGMIASAVLLLGFTGYVMLAVLNIFQEIPCSCGGVFSQLNWNEHLILNIIFSLIALTGMVSFLKERRSDEANRHLPG